MNVFAEDGSTRLHQIGDYIEQGELIGYMWNRGITGDRPIAHLHFGILINNHPEATNKSEYYHVDPRIYFYNIMGNNNEGFNYNRVEGRWRNSF